MQTIYATFHTSNFTVISNSLIDSAIPAKAQKVLLYLLSKPCDWKLRVTDIRHRLGLSTYSVRQALRWLMANGYAHFERLKSGFTNWFIYDTPKLKKAVSPDLIPCVEIPHVEFQSVLSNTEVLPNTHYYNSAQAIKQVQQDVVVSNAGAMEEPPPIPIPESLKGSQAKAAAKLLRNVTETQAALILMVFNAAQKAGKVANPVGYIHALVKAAQNGTLTAPESAQQAKPITAGERIAKEKQARKQAEISSKVENATFFEKMRQQYGDKFRVPA
jgi:DNA-binding MarR family transcriptional regulator